MVGANYSMARNKNSVFYWILVKVFGFSLPYYWRDCVFLDTVLWDDHPHFHHTKIRWISAPWLYLQILLGIAGGGMWCGLLRGWLWDTIRNQTCLQNSHTFWFWLQCVLTLKIGNHLDGKWYPNLLVLCNAYNYRYFHCRSQINVGALKLVRKRLMRWEKWL